MMWENALDCAGKALFTLMLLAAAFGGSFFGQRRRRRVEAEPEEDEAERRRAAEQEREAMQAVLNYDEHTAYGGADALSGTRNTAG